MTLNFRRSHSLPVLTSSEMAECALVSLAMVARYYGRNDALPSLRERFPVSAAGCNLRMLMRMAEAIGFSTRAIRIELDELGLLTPPAILHWRMNHFVVLKEVRNGRAIIHDPAVGMRNISAAELDRSFTGVALELEPRELELGTTAGTKEKPGRLVAPTLVPLWSQTFLALCASLFLQGLVFVVPFQLQAITDFAIHQSDVDLLAVIVLGFLFLGLFHAAAEVIRGWIVASLGLHFNYRLMRRVVSHLLRLPPLFFEKRHVGDLLSRLNSVTPIQDLVTRGGLSIVLDGLTALLALIIMFVYSVELGAIVIATLALVAGISAAATPFMRARAQEQVVARAREQGHMIESVRGARTIKLMGGEARRESAWRNFYTDFINATASVAKYQVGIRGAQQAVGAIGFALVVYLASRKVIGSEGFSLGMLFAFLSFRQMFADRVTSLITQGVELSLVGLHLDRVKDITDSTMDAEPAPSLWAVRGEVELRGVSFRYGDGNPWVLHNVDVSVKQGEFVAFIGPSGSGKTTLLKLLLGVLRPTDGAVFLDGHLATPAIWSRWREHIGFVTQDDQLLTGTIAQNIAFFDPEIDMERVEAAARKARIHFEIERMPMQYLALIGDMGGALSGGQRQRILLARALYREPKILILDEGTANLDPANDEAIAELVAELDITRIVVAHRSALLAKADRLVDLGLSYQTQEGGFAFKAGTRAISLDGEASRPIVQVGTAHGKDSPKC